MQKMQKRYVCSENQNVSIRVRYIHLFVQVLNEIAATGSSDLEWHVLSKLIMDRMAKVIYSICDYDTLDIFVASRY